MRRAQEPEEQLSVSAHLQSSFGALSQCMAPQEVGRQILPSFIAASCCHVDSTDGNRAYGCCELLCALIQPIAGCRTDEDREPEHLSSSRDVISSSNAAIMIVAAIMILLNTSVNQGC